MIQPLDEAPPLPLFVYGTLTDVEFASRLLQRRLAAEPAELLDHAIGELPRLRYKVAVPSPGESAQGLVYRHLTAADYERLDAYEGLSEGLYERGRGMARVGGGAAEPVSVYLPTGRTLERYASGAI